MTAPCRVLLVSHHALPHIGGVESLVAAEARALAAAGHEVAWVAARTIRNPPPLAPGIRLVDVAAWHVLERWFRIAYPIFAPTLWPVLWREVGRADVVHAHGCVFLSSWLALVIAWLRGKPRLLTDHGGELRYSSLFGTLALWLALATIGRTSARLATRLVAYNGRVEKLLARLAGLRNPTAERLLFLPNPVDRALFHPPTAAEREAARAELTAAQDISADRFVVLCVARLVADKGVLQLAAAANSEFEVVFCGPADEAMLAALARPGVRCLPPRPQAELVELYHAADLFVLPSWNEGFPVAIQEALACGLPVISGDDPGYDPYRGLAGLSFCEPRPEAIRAAILAARDRQRAAGTTGATATFVAQAEQIAADAGRRFPNTGEWLAKLFAGLVPSS